MSEHSDPCDGVLRSALEAKGQRFTEQRAAVHRFLSRTSTHPTADEVFLAVRSEVPGISLATVYKSLETLVGCGLAIKLSYGDGSARYDGRTDPHHHAHCLICGRIFDIAGDLQSGDLIDLRRDSSNFQVTGYRLELTGYCEECQSSMTATGGVAEA